MAELTGRARPVPLESLFEQLQPRPGGPAPEQVASHQRARLYRAMVEAAAEGGYGAVTMRRLTALAGVSTRTFYEQFSGKEDCFIRTYDVVVRSLTKKIISAQRAGQDWDARARLAIAAFAHSVASEPKAAQLALVETFTAGPASRQRSEHSSQLFERMVTVCSQHTSEPLELPPLVIKAVVAGLARVARARLLQGRAAELPQLVEELSAWVLSYCSPVTALLDDLTSEPSQPLGGLLGERTGGALDPAEPPPGDDRTRILLAALHIAGTRGVLSLSPGAIARSAEVSESAFSELFDDGYQCIISALEHAYRWELQRIVSAGIAAHDWQSGVQRALTTLAYDIANEPVRANVAFAEVLALGRTGIDCRESLMRGFARALATSARHPLRLSEVVAEAIVGALWEIIRHHLVRGEGWRLPQITGQLSYLVLTPVIGAQAAAQSIRAEQARLNARVIERHKTEVEQRFKRSGLASAT
ncbi:MAG TPA: TetR/AcrR family transcriptional regulator [Solirubrobacteraceae bacterium]|nr:TetR/AcrR family transcriptional regulator [Solirubrobacteraceae bacterium]